MSRIGVANRGVHCLILGAWIVFATAAGALTTVTEYTYNDDGALTQVTRQVDDGPSEAVFLSWDNFVPAESDASTGTVLPGNGTLSAIGAVPGIDNATERFRFDPRDRLLGYQGPAGDESYDYHAKGMMSSSSVGSDELRFFYDHAANAAVTNIQQSGTGTQSAYLGGVRYLDEGIEQVLLEPRKDIACSYEPDAERLESYVYEAYGAAPLAPPPAGTYDLRQNPFRFAGEYRDPIWGGYYLRARWYHPEYTVFLSRDPVGNRNRYGYTAGNPVMRVDPSGRSYMHSFGNPLGGFLKTINKGVGGHFVRLFLGPFLGPLQILADPGAFWHAVKTNQNGIDVFLALGVVSEVAGGFVDSYFARLGTSQLKRFLFRGVSDAALGLGQSAVAAANRGHGHFDWNTFVQGAEITASVIGWRALTRANVGKTKMARNGAGQLANDLDQTGARSGLLSRSPPRATGSSFGNEDSLSESTTFTAGDDSHPLPMHHDSLVDDLDDGEMDRFRIEQEVKERQRTVLQNRRGLGRSGARNDINQRLGSGIDSFVKNNKGSAVPVSRRPGFGGITEEADGTSSSFSNQASLHSHVIVDELE